MLGFATCVSDLVREAELILGTETRPCEVTHTASFVLPTRLRCTPLYAARTTNAAADNTASQDKILPYRHENRSHLNTKPTSTFGSWRTKGWEGQEAWTEEQQEQRQKEEAEGSTAEEAGYDGWVWDDTSGWYYDEALAAQLASGTGVPQDSAIATAADHNTPSGEDSDSGSGDSDDDSDDDRDSDSSSGLDGTADAAGEEAAERKRRRRKRRRRSLAPRNYPRSKAQRLVDEVEDSVDGARPEVLDLSRLDMDRVTSRVYRLDWLARLDLSSNRLYRISPDLAGMESLVDLNLRHNRWQVQRVPLSRGGSVEQSRTCAARGWFADSDEEITFTSSPCFVRSFVT